MYATNFEYDGEKLSDYGLMICSFGDSGGVESVLSGADITFTQKKPSGSPYFNLYSAQYETMYSTTFQVCRNPCYNIYEYDDMYLSMEEVSSVQRWLSRKEYHKFKIYQDYFNEIFWNATFTCKQINLGGYVLGLELTLYTDAPYAYRDEIELEYKCTSSSRTFDLYDISDEIGFIYPDMEIELLQNGTGSGRLFMLSNSKDKYTFQINGCVSGEKLTIDGRNLILSSNLRSSLADSFNYRFPKIINEYRDNKNTFTSNINCNIRFKYSPIAKVGL